MEIYLKQVFYGNISPATKWPFQDLIEGFCGMQILNIVMIRFLTAGHIIGPITIREHIMKERNE